MRILLHIGLPKTGTTALQQFLWAHRSTLTSRGILYPTHAGMGQFQGINHRILLSHVALEALAAGSIPNKAFPENALKTDPGRLTEAFERFWSATLQHIKNQTPKVLILSCEGLSHLFEDTDSPNALIKLRKLLEQAVSAAGFPAEELNARTNVIAYLRSPKAHFQSLAQQKFRFHQEVSQSTLLRPIDRIFEAYEHLFDQQVSVHCADRNGLIREDAVSDFVHKHLPEAIDLLPSVAPTHEVNQSLDTATLWALNQWLSRPPRWIPLSLHPVLRGELKNICAHLSRARQLRSRHPLQLAGSIDWAAAPLNTLYRGIEDRYGLSFEPWESSEDCSIENQRAEYDRMFRMTDVFVITAETHRDASNILRRLTWTSHLMALRLCLERILRWLRPAFSTRLKRRLGKA